MKLVRILFVFDDADASAAACWASRLSASCFCDCFKQELAGGLRHGEIDVIGLLPKRWEEELRCLVFYLHAVRGVECDCKTALHRAILVVDHHYLKRRLAPGRQCRLPEIKINTEWSECIAHVMHEVGIKLKPLDIAKMIGGISPWVAARQVNKMQNSGILAIGSPVFGDSCKQV